MRAWVHRLARDRRGVSVLEFAFVAPALCMALLAIGDILHFEYVRGVVDGEMQKAARDSAIEGGALKTAAIDAALRKQVAIVSPGARVELARKAFPTFQSLNGERFLDNNNNGRRDSGECFDDTLPNGRWDADTGRDGQGGANDVTRLTATVTWPRLFPMSSMLGWSAEQVVVSQTFLKNQPFAARVKTDPVCT